MARGAEAGVGYFGSFRFDQRAAAPFLATARRSSAVIRSSRAFPPCRPNTRAASMRVFFESRLGRFLVMALFYQPLSSRCNPLLDTAMALALLWP